jgi:hypothetical protein
MAAAAFGEGRRGTNIRHQLGGSAGYEDVNDAGRLAHDPAMRAIVGREGMDRSAVSTSQMGRFETEWLATEADLAALADRRPLTQGGKAPVVPRRKRDRGERPREAVSPPPRPVAHVGADPGASHHSAANACAVCARSQAVM